MPPEPSTARRIIRERLPEPKVEHHTTIAVTINVTVGGVLLYDAVPVPEPTRTTTCQFWMERHQRFDDLTGWPRARAETEALSLVVMETLEEAMHGRGLEVAEISAAPGTNNGAALSKEVTP